MLLAGVLSLTLVLGVDAARLLRNEDTPEVALPNVACPYPYPLPSTAAGNVGAATSMGVRLGAALERMRCRLLNGVSLVMLFMLFMSTAVAALLNNDDVGRLAVVVVLAVLLLAVLLLPLLLLLPMVLVAAVVLVINFFSLRAIVVLCH